MAMTALEHNNVLGILIMVRGGLLVLVGLLVGLFLAGGGALVMTAGHRHDDAIGGAFMMVGGIVAGIVVVGLGGFDLFTGTRIRSLAPIGRTLGIIACIMALFSFPLGTALGVYGLWFLFGGTGKALYLGPEAPAGNYDPPSQPPPNSWA